MPPETAPASATRPPDPIDEPDRRPVRRSQGGAAGAGRGDGGGGVGGPPEPPARERPRGPTLGPQEILARLNPPQQEAVSTIKGPLLILAGAGSGKTRVLAHRVAYLISLGVKPWQVVAVTFTNKAAGEMRERIAGLIGEEAARDATIGTFHAICARILRRDGDRIGLTRSFTIYDRADQVALVKTILRRLDLDEKRFSPAGMLAWIGQRKDELADVATAKRQAANFYDETAARVYDAYQRQLGEDDAVDFDDLLMRTVFLFEQHADVLAKYQNRWQFILVDEYQDTNRAQYLLCRHLAAKHKNLAVVGDDDQSIYSWRGADLRNILDFEADYPDAKVVKLEQNYRSTQTILDAAHAVVSRNAGRKDKRLWTDRGTGTQIELFDAYNEYEEAEFVARQIEKLVGGASRGSMSRLLTSRADDEDGSLRYGDIAVTYRINAQSRVIEESLMRFGIPYQLVGGTRFYERREVKDALAYVRLARNPGDRVALERIINVPARGIGAKTVEELRAAAEVRGISLWQAVEQAGENPNLAARSRTQLGAFAELMRGLMAMVPSEPPSAIFDAATERSGLREAILDGTEEGEERWANVTELRNHAAEFDEIAAPEGLEFPVVFIIGLEEGLMPHRRALEDERELEEERRLAYVGMTRAKDRLYLVHAHHRSTYGVGAQSEPSRFLSELPPDLLAASRSSGTFGRRATRGTDDDRGWLPSGYRSPTGRVREPLRPISLPDLQAGAAGGGGSARSLGRELDAARERIASATYDAGGGVDLGSGTFSAAGAAGNALGAEEEPSWHAGDRVRHRRFGDGIVVSSRIVKGDEEVTVAFVGEGVKRLVAAYAGLERA